MLKQLKVAAFAAALVLLVWSSRAEAYGGYRGYVPGAGYGTYGYGGYVPGIGYSSSYGYGYSGYYGGVYRGYAYPYAYNYTTYANPSYVSSYPTYVPSYYYGTPGYYYYP
jgi:hypothetical protein